MARHRNGSESGIRAALQRMVWESGAFEALALRLKRKHGWTWSDGAAKARLSQMLSPRDPHVFDADDLPEAIEETGLDYVTPLLLRAGMRRRRRPRQVRLFGPRGAAEGGSA